VLHTLDRATAEGRSGHFTHVTHMRVHMFAAAAKAGPTRGVYWDLLPSGLCRTAGCPGSGVTKPWRGSLTGTAWAAGPGHEPVVLPTARLL
jgi:hypothetical protein